MLGNMMQEQLLISGVLEHAEKYNANTEIVSNTIEGGIHKYTIKDSALRSKKLANALLKLGIEEGDVIATMAVNSYRHLELYFGISGLGAVLHTLNPRLFPEDIKYIVNHAEDKYIFVDTPFLPIIENVYSDLKSVKGVIVLTDKNNMPNSSLDNLIATRILFPMSPMKLFGLNLMRILLPRYVIRLARLEILKGCFIRIDPQFCMLGMLRQATQ